MLNLSTRGRYAARIMVNLARSAGDCAKSARTIAVEEDLSIDYVEQLLGKLKAAGFIKSRRGKQGGAMIARSPETINVAQLLKIIEGPTPLVPCIAEACDRKKGCPTHALWKEADTALQNVFENTSIADLAAQKEDEVLCFNI